MVLHRFRARFRSLARACRRAAVSKARVLSSTRVVRTLFGGGDANDHDCWAVRRCDVERRHGQREGGTILALVRALRMVDRLLVRDVPAVRRLGQRRWRVLPAECLAAADRRDTRDPRAPAPALMFGKTKSPGSLALAGT